MGMKLVLSSNMLCGLETCQSCCACILPHASIPPKSLVACSFHPHVCSKARCCLYHPNLPIHFLIVTPYFNTLQFDNVECFGWRILAHKVVVASNPRLVQVCFRFSSTQHSQSHRAQKKLSTFNDCLHGATQTSHIREKKQQEESLQAGN